MILMSNNQWKCDRNNDFWRERGEDCSAEARVPGMARAYLEVMPDILGLQEVSNRQAEILMDNMRHVKLDDGTEASYEYLSGRDTPIVYRRDKLKLLESGFFLYSTEVPGFEGSFNNSETKSWCWGVFEDRKDGLFNGAKYTVECGKYNTIEETLRNHNAMNRGIFFTVNYGGHSDSEISRINAQFVEIKALLVRLNAESDSFGRVVEVQRMRQEATVGLECGVGEGIEVGVEHRDGVVH